MPKRTLHPQEVKVAATFYEPAYQRLVQWHNGQNLHLLCFVAPTSKAVQQTIERLGAFRSQTFQAKCFAEIWELPDSPQLAAQLSGGEMADLDRQIADALGCLSGRYSPAAGTLYWTPTGSGFSERLSVSRLLEESRKRRGRG